MQTPTQQALVRSCNDPQTRCIWNNQQQEAADNEIASQLISSKVCASWSVSKHNKHCINRWKYPSLQGHYSLKVRTSLHGMLMHGARKAFRPRNRLLKISKPLKTTKRWKKHHKSILLWVVFIISVTAWVLMFLPVFAMFTCRQQNNIFPIVDVIQSIPGLRTYTS